MIQTDSNARAEKSQKRLLFLDGLRGIASLGVMFAHLFRDPQTQNRIYEVVPSVLVWLSNWGARGIEIFFVLSGFVIALSLSSIQIGRGAVLNFIIRRQLRLDPAYWLMLFAVFVSVSASSAVGIRGLFANMFYVHYLSGVSPILSVSWTLCLEVQFYLVFILILWSSTWFRPEKRSAVSVAGVFSLAVLSFILRSTVYPEDFPVFIASWYLFAFGTLVFWAGRNRRIYILCAILCIAMLAEGVLTRERGFLAGALTGALIAAAHLAGRIKVWLGGRAIQYFGKISYSLYLVHVVIIEGVNWAFAAALGGSVLGVWGLLAAGVVCSVVTAHLLYRFVERPTMIFAQSLRSGGKAGSQG